MWKKYCLPCIVFTTCIGGNLLKELKKIDDKSLLVEVQLLESRAFQKIGNITKARYCGIGQGTVVIVSIVYLHSGDFSY